MKLSDAEWTVMHVVWERFPVSAREVLEGIQPDTEWAYTTVKTMLARLVEKGALRVQMRANTSQYEPVLTRQQAQRSALRSLLDRAFDGTFGSLLQHMVGQEKLSRRDRAKLSQMLAELDQGSEKT
jgi:BlaI family penicillinase repressor